MRVRIKREQVRGISGKRFWVKVIANPRLAASGETRQNGKLELTKNRSKAEQA
jgi:hypothetical protein